MVKVAVSSLQESVDILVLGAGWTSTFLLPLLDGQNIKYAATTTTGRDGTIKFVFDPDSHDEAPYRVLPPAKTVLVTFPLKGASQSQLITTLYGKTHGNPMQWIQLGSTGAFKATHWNNRSSPVDEQNERVKAEEELLKLGPNVVLNLAGLYGGARQPREWLSRVIKTKTDIKSRKALHLVHGEDVSRAIIGAHVNLETMAGRWLITDLHVYDWWELIYEWAGEMEIENTRVVLQEAVFECMNEEHVRSLPRGPESLGRVLDSTAFWNAIGSYPVIGRVR